MEATGYEFNIPQGGSDSKIIKVIGVGGGGGNAVKYMYEMGIHDVDFYIVNTDIQALNSSPIPNKVQIGTALTAGLGAGAKPVVGRNAAEESREELEKLLGDNTKMVFITAGMGGGTGTGAAPVIAEIAKSLDILTVGIVTMPFKFEGAPKQRRAQEGIDELRQYCDTVLVILNEKLHEVYGKTSFKEAFSHADNVLTIGAKSIAEIITVEGVINVDFEDVNTVMKDSGAAVMGSAVAEGENRAIRATQGAIASPLLNNTNIHNAKYVLLSLVVSDLDSFQMEELDEITEYIRSQSSQDTEVIFGVATDQSLGESICVTIIATGFPNRENPNDEEAVVEKKTIHEIDSSESFVRQSKESISSEQQAVKPVYKAPATPEPAPVEAKSTPEPSIQTSEPTENSEFIIHEVEKPSVPNFEEPKVNRRPEKKIFDINDEYPSDSLNENPVVNNARPSRLRVSQLKSISDMSPDEIRERQEEPAFRRKGVQLNESEGESNDPSRYQVKKDGIDGGNRFLHDNVD
ncbi:cell division protein FtsZ [Sediminitomix flava]|uniref:Cell division protein FtsZ n=1 Tax=Sediminitomix flava TaxID=379075 RepID=A0A315Z9X7_SEDFL|nr:cell division protein FtsZ [Sediminitomix flava]PWJ42082.1 cell division protein FtsZ [Sediminitomix flava]